MQGYLPVYDGFSSIFRGFGSVRKHYLHMGITQLHTIQYGIFSLQVNAMTLKEEPSKRSLYMHTLQQIGRIYGNLLQGYIIHLYLALQ